MITAFWAANSYGQVFPLEDWQGKKIITLTLPGETEARRFILDTGSEKNYLYLPISQGYRTTSIKHVVTDGAGQKEYATARTKIDIQMLGYELAKAEFIYVPQADPLFERLQCAGISGIVGGQIIRQFDWYLTAHTVQISPRLSADLKAEFESVPLELWKKKKIPVLTAGFKDDYQSTMMFDLGDNTLVAIKKGNLQYIHTAGALAGRGGGYTTSVGEVSATQVLLHQSEQPFQIGGLQLAPILIDESPDISVIGSYFLNYFDVILDYQRKTFYFRRNDRPYRGFHTHGVSIGYDQGRPYIAVAWDVPDAPWAAVAVGDLVVAINGESVSEMSDTCALRQSIEAAWKQDEVSVTIEKPTGQTLTLTLANRSYGLPEQTP
ncbi:MAG TPA: hypothetical protein DCE41_24415 [Cytophagales bacterium]|nr:hypothetical protein [Cytophagales bacterium]HAA18259.1 hypothetical protein [Cytophagales bacterium]